MQIGIIAEGQSDQIAIEAIVQSYLNNKDIILDPLQPKEGESGGWPLVIKYCKSKDFKEALPYNEGLIIIHIDCDVLKGDGLPNDCVMQFNNLSNEETFEMVRQKFIEFITPEIFKTVEDKIVFAIAIDSIECWFLPIYYNQKSKQNKTTGCLNTLNTELVKKEGFYIDEKDEAKYRTISKHYFERKMIDRCYKTNESFKLFIDDFKRAFDNYEE
ncbi:hypothetical protein [uncultured Chryseobacterium sp.]|uniref:hypothetical protein n=1 Tax=uncultured Chryseobacterium sp. TaxID=259322 RepID=UPI0025D6B852|nr:hypothetical protein [uncultured Chryseobacterium sp.]